MGSAKGKSGSMAISCPGPPLVQLEGFLSARVLLAHLGLHKLASGISHDRVKDDSAWGLVEGKLGLRKPDHKFPQEGAGGSCGIEWGPQEHRPTMVQGEKEHIVVTLLDEI